MREAIGGTWIFTIVIAWIALFTTFVSVSTNYSRCYKLKDEIVGIIERHHGVNTETTAEINEYLNSVGYRSKDDCPDDGNCWIAFSVDSENAVSGYMTSANYCISRRKVTGTIETGGGTISDTVIGHPESAYYSVVVFFKIEWPILNRFFNIEIDGETSIVYLIDDMAEFDSC